MNISYSSLILSKLLALYLFLSFFRVGAFGQDNTQKERARISLDFYNLNNINQKLVASVRTRVEGFFQPVPEANIKFYRDSISEETLLGNVETNIEGEAEFTFSWLEDTALNFIYIASLENHPDYYDVEREVEIWKALMEMKTEEEDSLKMVRVFIGKPSETGEIEPVGDVNVQIFVKRLFGMLPVSEEYESTDEEGYFDFEFPSDIPGDESGNLTVVSRVRDHEEFGNLDYQTQVAWGVPVPYNQVVEARELWLSSSNVPHVLVIAVSLLVIGIIAVIVYIISILVQIKRVGMM